MFTSKLSNPAINPMGFPGSLRNAWKVPLGLKDLPEMPYLKKSSSISALCHPQALVCLLLFMTTEGFCMKMRFSWPSEGLASCRCFSPEAIILHLWLNNRLPGG